MAINTITDLIANFFGDTITDFSTEDQFVFQGLEIGRGNISVASGPTVLSVDSDKDTTPDGSFTLTGDFSGGDFMAVVTAGDTVVTYETFLPGLSETVSVDAADINGIDNQAFLTGTGAVDFRVTLDASAVSGYNNVLGVYEIDGTGALVDVRLLAEDIHAAPSFSTLITGVEAGNALGFFIVQNGAAWAASLGGGVAFSFVNTANDAANLSDGSDLKLAVDNVATDKVVFHSYDLTMNADTVQHVLSGVVTGGLSIEIGFEDMTGGGDLDYQDVVFTVDLV